MQETDKNPPCLEKASYADERQATAAAIVARHQHGTKLRPYLCKYCGLWHLASDYS